MSSSGRTQRLILQDDLRKLQQGNLGLRDQQKEKMVAEATAQASSQAQAQQAEIGRQALAQGGPAGQQFTGQAALLQRELGKQTQAAAGQAATEVNKMDVALAEAQRQDTIARAERQQDRIRENVMFGVENIMNVAAIVGAVLGAAGAAAA